MEDVELASAEQGPWLVQPFADSIERQGEWSLMLFAGELSHTVLKRPAPGEYRVQREWGGTSQREEPDEDLMGVATRALQVLDRMPLYARVDLVRWNGSPHLMELELIEPQLFLENGDRGLDVLIERLAG